MTKLSTQAYKGTRDFFPEDQRIQNWMFDGLKKTARSFGYEEYNGPMLEPFELYAAKTGEEIVNQQLYWLMDRGERKLAVRPEMTPTLARMVAQKIHELPKPIRWFSIPNLWRYERPQRGRLREHWQLNVDVLGGDSVLADAEILKLAFELVKNFGGGEWIEIRINHRGLMDSVFKTLELSAETAHQVMKALDSRAKIGEEAYSKWVKDLGISDSVFQKLELFFKAQFEQIKSEHPCAGVTHLESVFDSLVKMGVPKDRLIYDPQILRGMDYYTGTVFEIYDTSPENRRALFGGGRYDDLMGLFGAPKLSGVGFGMGDVGLQNFLQTHALLPVLQTGVDVFVTLPEPQFFELAHEIAASIRGLGLKTVVPLEVAGFSQQLKQASKLGAKYCVLLGPSEVENQQVIIKNLKEGTQVVAPFFKWDGFLN